MIVFLITIAWMLSTLGRTGQWRRMRAFLGWGIGLAMIVENSIIAMQSLRGVPSHMNFTSTFNALSFAVMGLFIALNTALAAMLLFLYLVTRTRLPAAMTLGICLGLLTLLAGSAEGAYMVTHGAHTVGARDGLAGLPFVNWSTRYGDLRIAHFFALHALQIFPLAGILVSLSRLRTIVQASLIGVLYAGYMGAVWLLFRQAMQGQPLLSLNS